MTTDTADLFASFPYVGALAYVDSFGGLVPCRVDIREYDGGATVRVTADRRGYRRGEVLRFSGDEVRRGHLVARTAVRTVGGTHIIRNPAAEGA